MRLHRIERRIAVRRIHIRMKHRMQRHRMIAHIQREVRRIRLAIDRDPLQLPRKLPRRRQHPTQPFDRIQVRMVEAVHPIHPRSPRIVPIPRPKVSLRMDRTHRLRID